MTHSASTTSLRPYLTTFALALVILSLILALADIWLGRGGMNGVKFILPFLASMFAVESFLKKERRLPGKSEKSRLVWISLGLYVAVELAFTLFSVLTGGLEEAANAAVDTQMLVIVIVGILLFVCLANFFLMRWAYGGLLEKRAARLGIDLGDTFD